jgi:hypothetical protein
MAFLRSVPFQPVVYPYTLQQLQADILLETDGRLIINLTADLSFFTVEPYYLFPVFLVARPLPSIPRTKVVEEATPIFVGGQWVQVWSERDATPQEVADWDISNALIPDWPGFQLASMTAPLMNQIYVDCQSSVPCISAGIPSLIIQSAQGDLQALDTLAEALGILFLNATATRSELLDFLDELEVYNLPTSFTAALLTAINEVPE